MSETFDVMLLARGRQAGVQGYCLAAAWTRVALVEQL